MRAIGFTFANQPSVARKGDPMALWHREGTQALGMSGRRIG